MKRKIAAILAADIAGYSKLVAEDEEETVRRLGSYRGVIDDFIARAGGRIFNTAGDAVLAEFSSSVEAVRCAIDIQESLRTRNLAYPPSRQMNFRIGINVGDVMERESDLLGDAVNVAARLESLAEAGGICVSRTVYEQVANKLSVQFADIGEQQVKNIPTPVHAYMVAIRGAEPQPVPPQPASRMPAAAIVVLLGGAGFAAWTMAPGWWPGAGGGTPAPAATAATRAAAPLPPADETDWQRIAASDDLDALRRFVTQYPASRRRPEAEARIAALAPPDRARLDEGKVRALAEQQSIPLPPTIRLIAPSAAVPAKVADYMGAWGGEHRWNSVGRNSILLVTHIDEAGTAIGIFASGPPNERTFDQFPANFRPFTGTITDDGLKFELAGGNWKYAFKLRPDGVMQGLAEGPRNTRPVIAIGRID